MFPSESGTIANPDLLDALDGLDRVVNSPFGSSAEGWRDLGNRMDFITDFFRSRQRDASLFEPPFRAEQVVANCEENIPGRVL